MKELINLPRWTPDRIVYNAIQTPDGTVIESRHRHDFVCHEDKNGKRYCVDGGMDYLRRVGDSMDHKDISVLFSAPIEEIREVFAWGTYGKDGYQPLTRLLLKNMVVEHMEAIIDDGYPAGVLMQRELQYRIDTGVIE